MNGALEGQWPVAGRIHDGQRSKVGFVRDSFDSAKYGVQSSHDSARVVFSEILTLA